MKRGPKPKSAAQKEREGNPGQRAIPPEPDIGRSCAPEPPEFFTADHLAVWHSVVPVLVKAGSIAVVDFSVLVDFCTAYIEAVDLEQDVKLEGVTVSGAHGTKRNPKVMVRNAAWGRVRQCRAELGLSPSTRVGLSPAQKSPSVADRDPAMFSTRRPDSVN